MATRQPKFLNQEALWSLALRSLGGRAHSTGELREKLRRRAQSPNDVDAVLARLKDAGYLNDRRFAENYAVSRLENQGFGKMRVLRDLRQRRVAPELAEKVTDETFRDSDETVLIEQFLERKYRGKKLATFLAEEKNLAAAFRRLRYAGFSAGASIRVLKRYASQADDLDQLENSEDESTNEEDDRSNRGDR